jgi:peptidylprolyl isomerase
MILPVLAACLGQAQLVSTDLTVGKGDTVKPYDFVTVQYRGTLNDGKVFDSSYEREEPFAFQVSAAQVIAGWDTGVVGMKVGGKRRLVIPPGLAYGDRAVGEIPANSTLNFEIEVVKIDRAKVEIVRKGSGTEEAAPGDLAEVHYTGTFPDGRKFDSSRDPGREPLSIDLRRPRLIAGFLQGLSGMKVGERRKVTIPFGLAYGKEGRPPVIPPEATLVFDLELVKLTKAKARA